jgi:hypothetical protein
MPKDVIQLRLDEPAVAVLRHDRIARLRASSARIAVFHVS